MHQPNNVHKILEVYRAKNIVFARNP